MHVRASVSNVNDVVRPDLLLCLQLVENRNLPVSRCGVSNRFDLPGRSVAKFSSVDVISRDNAIERRLNDLDWSGRKNIEIEMISFDPVFQDLIQQRNICLQANALAHLVKVLPTDAASELGIMQ